jgi:hypothetical protein
MKKMYFYSLIRMAVDLVTPSLTEEHTGLFIITGALGELAWIAKYK